MAYPRHWLLAFGGSLNADGLGTEQWQCGIRGEPGVESAYGEEEATLDNIAPVIATWFADQSNRMRNDVTLKWIKLNEIAPDGSYAGDETHQHDFTTPVAGGEVPSVPPILTVAWSWTTAVPRGFAHTGRIYPPVALGQQNTMTLAGGVVAAHVAAAKRLLDAVSAASSVNAGTSFRGLQPRVVSSHGVMRAIEGVRVGNILDVQRRRKDALVEAYTASSWP